MNTGYRQQPVKRFIKHLVVLNTSRASGMTHVNENPNTCDYSSWKQKNYSFIQFVPMNIIMDLAKHPSGFLHGDVWRSTDFCLTGVKDF